MNKLKKSLALIATLAIASTALVACGGGETSTSTAEPSSSKAEESKAEESKAEEESKADEESKAEESKAEENQGGENKVADGGDKLSFLCWTGDDVNAMIQNFTDNTDYTKDQIEWVQVGKSGGEAREQYSTYFAGDGDVDLFVMEADWILDYINNDEYSAPLTDLGFSESDFDGCYKYTLSVGTDKNGVLKGVSWQATPGGYVYRTDLAEEYLGAKTPDEMQEFVKDWDTFTKTAEKVKSEHNTAMADTLGGMWQVWQYNRSTAWVDSSDTLQIDDFCKDYAELAKEYYEKGYVTKEAQWTDGWNNIMQDGSTMGAFLCTWCFGKDGTLSGMEGNSKTEDAAEWKVDGPTGGKFNITAGPSGWAWGGSWFGLSPKCDNGTIAHDFVKYFTVDEASIEKYALYKSEFVNNPTVMKKIVDDKANSNPYLGGQDQFSVLYSAASTIDMSNVTAYDAQIKSCFNDAVTAYVNGTVADYDAMINQFKTDVAAKVEAVTVE
jgi:ABC-type glycerol-3-phosphate transport system substrate-binding protein